MSKTSVKHNAILQPDLLIKVAEFKNKFYPRGWAKYDEARIGSLKLMPAEHSIERIASDYEKMKSMIYGNIPRFDEVLNTISQLETEINSTKIN